MNGKGYSAELIDYLLEFHGTRDYFECHEIMEEYWKEQGMSKDPLSKLWVGLIQIAVGQYHHRRGNITGAEKMLGKALVNLKREDLAHIGISGDELLQIVEAKWKELQSRKEKLLFHDFDIPLADPGLLRHCITTCERKGFVWGAPSRMGDDSLIHRHKLRDRSEVIAARMESAVSKRQNREGRLPD